MHPHTQHIDEVAHDTKHSNDFDSNESMPDDPEERLEGRASAARGGMRGGIGLQKMEDEGFVSRGLREFT